LTVATEFIERNAHTDFSLDDIACIVHVTPRALQMAFRRRLGTTPRDYVFDVRLQRAHEELVAADAVDTTIAEVASHWAFRHPGRFARRYRQKYGCNPKVTLKAPRQIDRRPRRRAG
jgi:transcriptional regulator GlxA family with amidase domain